MLFPETITLLMIFSAFSIWFLTVTSNTKEQAIVRRMLSMAFALLCFVIVTTNNDSYIVLHEPLINHTNSSANVTNYYYTSQSITRESLQLPSELVSYLQIIYLSLMVTSIGMLISDAIQFRSKPEDE